MHSRLQLRHDVACCGQLLEPIVVRLQLAKQPRPGALAVAEFQAEELVVAVCLVERLSDLGYGFQLRCAWINRLSMAGELLVGSL